MILSWNPAFATFFNSWPSETIFSSTVLTIGWRGPMAANRQHFRTWPSTTVESEVFRLSNGAGSNIRIFIYQNQSVFSTAFLPPYFVNFPCLILRIPFILFFSLPIALFPVSCLHRFTMQDGGWSGSASEPSPLTVGVGGVTALPSPLEGQCLVLLQNISSKEV